MRTTRANANLEKFSYSIAHDLRAPLRAIHGFASILEQSLLEATSDQHQYLDRIKANSVRMGDLVDDILTFSRVTRGEMKTRQVNIERLANDVVAQIAGDYPQVTVRIGALPAVCGDPRLLQRVFENLLTNALKFPASASTRWWRLAPRRAQMGRWSISCGIMVRVSILAWRS